MTAQQRAPGAVLDAGRVGHRPHPPARLLERRVVVGDEVGAGGDQRGGKRALARAPRPREHDAAPARPHRRGMEDAEQPPRPPGRLEQRGEAAVTRQGGIGRRIVGSGEHRVLGADGEPAVLLDHVHGRERAVRIPEATRTAGCRDHPGEDRIVAAHPHRAVARQVDRIERGRALAPSCHDGRRGGGGGRVPSRRAHEAQRAPRRQGAGDAAARDLPRQVAFVDARLDQIGQRPPRLERLPEPPTSRVEGRDRAIRSDHHQLIRERQRHRAQLDPARREMPRHRALRADQGATERSVVPALSLSLPLSAPLAAAPCLAGEALAGLEQDHGDGRRSSVAPEHFQRLSSALIGRAGRWRKVNTRDRLHLRHSLSLQ